MIRAAEPVLPDGNVTLDPDLILVFGKLALGLHALGIVSAGVAVKGARTSQGAIAWTVALIAFPYLSLPAFWIFGRDRFNGYSVDRQDQDAKVHHLRLRACGGASSRLAECIAPDAAGVFESLASMRFTGGNDARLLVNGPDTFAAIFAAMEGASNCILVQFFIVHDDRIGRDFKRCLLDARRRGVTVYFLFDEIGSHALPSAYVAELAAAGVMIRPFKTTKGAKNRFQINFRNHRKIVVVDAAVAFVGGHNVGDEYLGRDPKFGLWRDTHVRLEGPCVLQVQASFSEDWHWSHGDVPNLTWEVRAAPGGDKAALVLPSGPADKLDTCCLFFLQAIQEAKERLWITSPYFVPDAQIVSALQLAALRGVDVRILLPSLVDHVLVYLASFSFLDDVLPHGIKLFRFQGGFLHEKVLLVDDRLAAVGTANFDNRSFRLNFEITVLLADHDFAKEVEAMLLADFAHSRPVTMAEITGRRLPFRVAVQVARLLAPIL